MSTVTGNALKSTDISPASAEYSYIWVKGDGTVVVFDVMADCAQVSLQMDWQCFRKAALALGFRDSE